MPWRDVHVWWGDDRYVPRDHPLSNVKPFDDILLGIGVARGGHGRAAAGRASPLAVRPDPPVPDRRGDRDGPRAAGAPPAMADELRAAGPRGDDDGWPVFDLVLLGVGARRAHPVGLPGLAGARLDRPGAGDPGPDPHRAARRAGDAQPGRRRRRARRSLVVATGADKAPVLGEIFGPTRDPSRVAGPARAARGRDLDPRRGRGRRTCRRGPDRGREPTPPIASREPTPRPVGRRHAHRGLPERRRAAAHPGPRREPRDHTTFRVVGPRLARHVHGPRHRPSRPRRVGRHRSRTRSSASSRTWPRSRTRWRRRPADRCRSSATRTAAGCALGAALLTDADQPASSAYEGAPTPPGASYHPTGLDAELRGSPRGRRSGRAPRHVHDPGRRHGPRRSSRPTAPIRSGRCGSPRRRRSCASSRRSWIPAASLETLGRVRQPVLQLLGGESLPAFREATYAFDARLADGRVVEIPGAKHAAHHTQPDAVVDGRARLRGGGRTPVRD